MNGENMVKQKAKHKNKTDGKEIIQLYKDMKSAGVTPEQTMLYLMGHMQQTKSTKIGMDLKGAKGEEFCITVSVGIGSLDDQEEAELPPVKKTKYTMPMVQ
jgi:hypothetical protein